MEDYNKKLSFYMGNLKKELRPLIVEFNRQRTKEDKHKKIRYSLNNEYSKEGELSILCRELEDESATFMMRFYKIRAKPEIDYGIEAEVKLEWDAISKDFLLAGMINPNFKYSKETAERLKDFSLNNKIRVASPLEYQLGIKYTKHNKFRAAIDMSYPMRLEMVSS